jgi:hypothetical protein
VKSLPRLPTGRVTHTFAETQIKPRAVEMATCVLGEQSKKKPGTVQLSNNAVKCRIQDLSADIEKQLVSRHKSSYAFSLQLGESTDVSGLAVLFVFVHYVFRDKMQDDALLCRSLESRETGEEMFNVIVT